MSLDLFHRNMICSGKNNKAFDQFLSMPQMCSILFVSYLKRFVDSSEPETFPNDPVIAGFIDQLGAVVVQSNTSYTIPMSGTEPKICTKRTVLAFEDKSEKVLMEIDAATYSDDEVLDGFYAKKCSIDPDTFNMIVSKFKEFLTVYNNQAESLETEWQNETLIYRVTELLCNRYHKYIDEVPDCDKDKTDLPDFFEKDNRVELRQLITNRETGDMVSLEAVIKSSEGAWCYSIRMSKDTVELLNFTGPELGSEEMAKETYPAQWKVVYALYEDTFKEVTSMVEKEMKRRLKKEDEADDTITTATTG